MTAVTPGLGFMSAFTNAGRGLHLFLVHSFLKNNFIYLFIFICTGFSLLHGLFSRQGEWVYSLVAASGFLLWYLLLLWSLGSRALGASVVEGSVVVV